MDLPELLANMAPYGLDEGEALVYYHLSRTGGARASDVADAAKRKRPDTYRLLDSLVMKGFVEKTLERPTRFLPVPIHVAIQRCVEARRTEAAALATAATGLVQAWPRPHAEAGPGHQRFTVFQGKDQVQGLLHRMCAAARDEITVVASPGGLAHLGLAAFLAGLEPDVASQVHVRVLTKPDVGRAESLKPLQAFAEIRHAELPSYHQMIIVDAQQIALFVSSGRKVSTHGDVQTVLWLNTPDFVLAQKALFDAVWATGVSSDERAAAADEGRLPNETRLLRGRWQRLDRMRRMVAHATQTIWIRAPKEETARWSRGGLGRSLAKKASEGVAVMVWTDGPMTIRGATRVESEAPASMECLVDGVQALSVSGARDDPHAMAFEGEWSVWSTHRDTVAAVLQRFEVLPDPVLEID